MKKKKAVFYSAIALCILTAAIGIHRSSGLPLSDLALDNSEALADEEQYVRIPCVIDKMNICEYPVMLADGTTGTRIDYNMRRVDDF